MKSLQERKCVYDLFGAVSREFRDSGQQHDFRPEYSGGCELYTEQHAKIECGRAFAQTGAVTLDKNVISDNCVSNDFGSGRSDFGSSGFNPASSNLSVVPEPGTLLLLGISLLESS